MEYLHSQAESTSEEKSSLRIHEIAEAVGSSSSKRRPSKEIQKNDDSSKSHTHLDPAVQILCELRELMEAPQEAAYLSYQAQEPLKKKSSPKNIEDTLKSEVEQSNNIEIVYVILQRTKEAYDAGFKNTFNFKRKIMLDSLRDPFDPDGKVQSIEPRESHGYQGLGFFDSLALSKYSDYTCFHITPATPLITEFLNSKDGEFPPPAQPTLDNYPSRDFVKAMYGIVDDEEALSSSVRVKKDLAKGDRMFSQHGSMRGHIAAGLCRDYPEFHTLRENQYMKFPYPPANVEVRIVFPDAFTSINSLYHSMMGTTDKDNTNKIKKKKIQSVLEALGVDLFDFKNRDDVLRSSIGEGVMAALTRDYIVGKRMRKDRIDMTLVGKRPRPISHNSDVDDGINEDRQIWNGREPGQKSKNRPSKPFSQLLSSYSSRPTTSTTKKESLPPKSSDSSIPMRTNGEEDSILLFTTTSSVDGVIEYTFQARIPPPTQQSYLPSAGASRDSHSISNALPKLPVAIRSNS